MRCGWWFGIAVAAVAAAGCNGGSAAPPPLETGSRLATPSPSPSPVPTLNPACKALAPQTTGSTYTLQSNPSGITVQRVDPSVTTVTCAYFTGQTPATDRPQVAPHPWDYVFNPSQANPYVVSVAQQFNGDHSIFYNQAGDSSGSINAASLQGLRRAPASDARRGDDVRRGIRPFTEAGVAAGQVLVRFRGSATQMRARAAQLASIERALPGAEIVTAAGSYERFVSVPAGTDAASFAAKLRANGDVADVFPVHLRRALGRTATSANDPHFRNVDQWYLFADGFPNAWSYANGSAAKLAVIDTGIDLNNTDLTANYLGGRTIAHPSGGCSGAQTLNTTPQDTNGHGTNVAGIAAAAVNNALGFAGAGDNVKLLAYDIFPDATAASDQQTSCTSDEVQAIGAAVAAGADVINLSLGGTDFDQGEHDAIEAAIAAGVTVVAAAGNDAGGSESGTPQTVLDYPAAYDGVLAAGASALRDNDTGNFSGSSEYVAPYSQSGPGLGVVAPGGDPRGNDNDLLHWIWNYSTTTATFGPDQCTYANGTLPHTPTNCTALFAGTSQAAPQVAAAAALLIAAAGGHHALTPARVVQIIDDTADNIGDPRQGHGRLNAYKAIATLFNDTGAYSGPSPQKTSPTQAVAFAYANSGQNRPSILDVNYPTGIPLNSAGTFRIADVPANAGTYKVGVWYDANGDGIIDAGDQFGSAGPCVSTQPCTIGPISLTAVAAGFVLP